MYHSAQKIESRTKTAVILSTNVDISSAEKPRLQATWSKQTLVCLAKSLKFKFTDLVRTALISYKLHKTLVQLSYTINSYNYMYYCTKTLQYFIIKANVDCPSNFPHALNSTQNKHYRYEMCGNKCRFWESRTRSQNDDVMQRPTSRLSHQCSSVGCSMQSRDAM